MQPGEYAITDGASTNYFNGHRWAPAAGSSFLLTSSVDGDDYIFQDNAYIAFYDASASSTSTPTVTPPGSPIFVPSLFRTNGGPSGAHVSAAATAAAVAAVTAAVAATITAAVVITFLA